METHAEYLARGLSKLIKRKEVLMSLFEKHKNDSLHVIMPVNRYGVYFGKCGFEDKIEDAYLIAADDMADHKLLLCAREFVSLITILKFELVQIDAHIELNRSAINFMNLREMVRPKVMAEPKPLLPTAENPLEYIHDDQARLIIRLRNIQKLAKQSGARVKYILRDVRRPDRFYLSCKTLTTNHLEKAGIFTHDNIPHYEWLEENSVEIIPLHLALYDEQQKISNAIATNNERIYG